MHTCILGIDCATDPPKRGFAFAQFENDFCRVFSVETGLSDANIAELVVKLKKSCERVLLALDAPLGWPDALGSSLAGHHAGQPLNCSAHHLFRRETDRFIKEKFAKQPLDVGADRIARTAHSALCLLAEISEALGTPIPLAWGNDFTGIAAIEVYPAATLITYGLPSGGYKKPLDKDTRQIIVNGFPRNLLVPETDLLLANADALDAVVCTLAATDFIQETTYQPQSHDLACKEGWIWVKSKER